MVSNITHEIEVVLIAYYIPYVVLSIQLPGISESICDVTNLSKVSFFWSFWLSFMSSETLLCTLVVIRAIQRMSENRRRRQALTWVENGCELALVLIRDSIIYFLV